MSSLEATSRFGSAPFRKLHQRNKESTAMITAPAETPTAVPTFALVLSPAGGEEVVEGNDSVFVAGKLATKELEGEDVVDNVVVVGREEADEERCWVAVLADEAMVVKGIPVPESRNLPTPVLQQLFVWSQQ